MKRGFDSHSPVSAQLKQCGSVSAAQQPAAVTRISNRRRGAMVGSSFAILFSEDSIFSDFFLM
jgi:hypothetical protein